MSKQAENLVSKQAGNLVTCARGQLPFVSGFEPGTSRLRVKSLIHSVMVAYHFVARCDIGKPFDVGILEGGDEIDPRLTLRCRIRCHFLEAALGIRQAQRRLRADIILVAPGRSVVQSATTNLICFNVN